jgi:two-component system, NtrC family, sensor kinase
MNKFSHPGSAEMTPIDINRAIENTITVCRNEWKYIAEMRTDFDESLPLLVCMAGEINQVILNIVVNAAHAVGDVIDPSSGQKGQITIRTRADGESVKISITDTGTGIAAKHRSRIFDPFFTTKEVGKGTGQGLTMEYNVIVNKHGGRLDFDTEEGNGTTFHIRLPLAGQALERESGSKE